MPAPLEGPAAVGHLLRRAGFGPRADTWDTWSQLPYDEAVDRVVAELDTPVAEDPKGFDPYQPGAIQQTWLARMLTAPTGAAEKLAFFWHGHFATSDTKIIEPYLMWQQYRLFRMKGTGSFRELVKGVNRDVAMIRWLDGNANRKGQANENYARELQELFTLGIGNYTEQDIREIARAFTGWGSRHHDFVLKAHFHDDGEKSFHGKTGNFDGDDAVDILVELPACPRFIAGKLLRFYSHPDPSAEEVGALAGVLRANELHVGKTLAHLFRSEGFRDAAHRGALVKSPVEFAVGALRAVGQAELPDVVANALGRMGQILFRPPSVKGWPSGPGWLSSAGIVERLKAAKAVAALVPDDAVAQTDAAIVSIALQQPIPSALTDALRETKDARARIALVLGGPEFQLG